MLTKELALAMIASALSTTSALRAGEPLNLTYKWEINRTVTYQVTQDSNQKMSGTPMGDMEGSTHQVSTLSLTPKEGAEDGSTTIEASFTSIRLEMQPLMQPTKFSYDTAHPGADGDRNPLAAIKVMVDKPFTVVLGADGSVKKVEGVQAIADQIGPGGGGPAAASMARQLKTTFNDQTIGKLFEVAFHHLPGKSVEPGSTWDSSYEMPLPQMGTMKAAGVATLTSAGGGNATIDSTYTITLEPAAAGETAHSMMQNIKVENASGQSTTVFDAGSGVLRHHTGKVTMPTSISMKGQNGQETTITILINSGTTLELMEAK
jgi:hypothetical protein